MLQIPEIELEECARVTLEEMRRNHPEAYLRERAAAILKVADGQPVEQVALGGLSQLHDPQIVAVWIQRYLRFGLSGLYEERNCGCQGRRRQPR